MEQHSLIGMKKNSYEFSGNHKSEATKVEQPKALVTSEVYYYRYLCEHNK
jgi:hypothetical protein